MEVHPFETGRVEVHLVERGARAVEAVQLAHQGLELAVAVEFQQLPAHAGVAVPLLALADLLAHEEQFLAGVGPHIGQEGAHVGKLAPFVAGHFVQQRALAVDHFVV